MNLNEIKQENREEWHVLKLYATTEEFYGKPWGLILGGNGATPEGRIEACLSLKWKHLGIAHYEPYGDFQASARLIWPHVDLPQFNRADVLPSDATEDQQKEYLRQYAAEIAAALGESLSIRNW